MIDKKYHNNFKYKYLKYKKKYIKLKGGKTISELREGDNIEIKYQNISYLKAKIIQKNENKITLFVDVSQAIKDNNGNYVFKTDDDDLIVKKPEIELDIDKFKKMYPRDSNGILIPTNILNFSINHYTYDSTATLNIKDKIIYPRLIDIDSIYAGRDTWDTQKSETLLKSDPIKDVLPPIVVEQGEDDFAIENGNHRYRYSRVMGYTTIPAFVI